MAQNTQGIFSANEKKIIKLALQMLRNSITRSANKMVQEGRNAIAEQMAAELKDVEAVSVHIDAI